MKFPQNSNQMTAAFIAVVIMLTILGSTYFLSNTDFYIRDSSTAVSQDGQVVNTISVSGDGVVYTSPDMVIFTVTVSEEANTSSEALEKANEKITEIQDKLDDANVSKNDIQTTDFSISPNYEWRNDRSVLVGQIAEQTLTIKVKDIKDDARDVADLIDSVVEVDGVRLGYIRFDLEDKTDEFSLARELAFEKARQKASDLAKYGDLELLEPVSIIDNSGDTASSQFTAVNTFREALDDSGGGTNISSGQLEVSIRLNVKFGIAPK